MIKCSQFSVKWIEPAVYSDMGCVYLHKVYLLLLKLHDMG